MKHTKKEAVPRQQTQPPNDGANAKSTTSIIPDLPADVKALRDLRAVQKISVGDIVGAVAANYPKFDRYLLSKVEHGDEYGIRLRADAEALLFAKFSPRQGRTPARRRKPRRIQARLDEDVYARLQAAVRADRLSVQQLLERAVLDYLLRRNPTKGENHDDLS